MWKLILRVGPAPKDPLQVEPTNRVACRGHLRDTRAPLPEPVTRSCLSPEPATMRISARNTWKGRVLKIIPGAVNDEVTIRIARNVEVVAIVSKTSVKRLELKPGADAYAIVKASSVLIGVD